MADLEKTGATPQEGGQVSGGAGAEQGAGVPKGLERFAGQDGKVDLNKLGQSYLELERGFHGTKQEMAALQRAYSALAPKAAPADPVEDVNQEMERFVQSPKKFTESVAQESINSQARQVKAAILELAHPEMKDPQFKKELQEFAARELPPTMQANLDDYYTADWVVKLFKQQKQGAAGAGADEGQASGSQHIESPSGSPSKVGKTWKRSEILKMQHEHPDEYERQADAIAQAYDENRVIKDA